MVQNVDVEKVSSLVIETAHGIIMPYFEKLTPEQIFTKSSATDFVTVADREAEAFMTLRLKEMYPGCIVIGEESIAEKTATLESLKERDRLIFVLDPVDGTTNFKNKIPVFGVMVAAVYNGEITHGWIYDVIGDRMMVAQAGKDTTLNGVILKTAADKPEGEMAGYIGKKYFPEAVRPDIDAAKAKFASLKTLSCAAHEYINVASGAADFGIYSKVRPWDHLAGTLAVRQAGGDVALWNGQPYNDPYFQGNGLLVASSAETARLLREGLVAPLGDKILAIQKKRAADNQFRL